MPEDLQPGASTEEPTGATPEGPQAEPEPKLIPETDLRAFQSQADKRQADLQRQADEARQRAADAEQRLGALQASMNQLARETMEPADADAFISQQQQAQEYGAMQRDAVMWRRQQFANNLAQQYEIPIAEFQEVINDPSAQQQDAMKVVTDYLQKQAQELGKAHATAQTVAETAAAKTERQARRTDGSDQIGRPAEPATGSADLRSEYDKKAKEIVRQSQARPRAKNWAVELISLKAAYREKGLDI